MNGNSSNNCNSADIQMDMFSDTWGFSLEDLYKLAVTFYKGMYIFSRASNIMCTVDGQMLFNADKCKIIHIIHIATVMLTSICVAINWKQ